MSTASSRSGAITVRTTEQGLPIGISIERSELRRDPDHLAQEILRLCKQSANRAGLERRAELVAAGVSKEVIDQFDLPKPEDVAREEDAEDYEIEPQSWLRSI